MMSLEPWLKIVGLLYIRYLWDPESSTPNLRHDPQLRIVPSMPIILQMCAPKHATFV